ncbi:MAG TPA: ATP-binding protein [Vicinamibacterales bacterium]|jgi:two-component system sensor histidine kinase RegB
MRHPVARTGRVCQPSLDGGLRHNTARGAATTSADPVVFSDTQAGAGTPRGNVRAWWLVRLRWGWVVGQVILIGAIWGSAGVDFPIGLLLALVGAMGVTNAGLAYWMRHRPLSEAWSAAILAFDMLQLTALLSATGGAANPFSVFYLVHITAAAVTLGSRWTWCLTAFGVSCYATLFALSPTDMSAGAGGMAFGHGHEFTRHLQVMWVALTLAAALTAFFVTRLTTGLARQDREIQRMREAAAKAERLSALTTLAAGAAHELATPLMTVAVVAGELERNLTSLPSSAGGRVADDIRLIRGEVNRCREILNGIGSAAGEMPTTFTLGEFVRDVLGGVAPEHASRVTTHVSGDDARLFLPRRALVRVVSSLIDNALRASAAGQPIALRADAGRALDIVVRDEGIGMSAEILARAEEPFFTTKAPGHGLGLGLTLARSLAEQLGGRFDLDSAPGRGTTARLELPVRVKEHAGSN